MSIYSRNRCYLGIILALCCASWLDAQQTQTVPRQGSAKQPYGPPTAEQARRAAQRRQNLAAVNPAQVASQPRVPFQLNADEQKRLNSILDFWEKRSNKVQTYSCRFTRWEYDPVFGPRDPNTAKTKSLGTIRYAAPDKGEFRVETTGKYTPPGAAGGTPTYQQMPVELDEHWICDGATIYELDKQKKQLIETQLPPEMRGKQIADGPLPFMFGATKDKLIARYWIREIRPPDNRKGEFWLEVYPKRRDDAANFSQVLVILDEKSFLPTALLIRAPNFNPKANGPRTSYQFADRKVNDPIQRSQDFLRIFIAPTVPLGWKKVANDFRQPTAGPAQTTATRPSSPQKDARTPRRK